jgi:putative DNA primase/helicase
LTEIAGYPEVTAEWVRRERDGLLAAVQIGADGQVQRVARRFAVVAAAGEIATDIGVLPWKKGDVTAAARKCYDAWLHRRGTTGPSELEQGIAQIRRFFEQHGASRFEGWSGDMGRVTINRCGFRKPLSEFEGGATILRSA